MVPGIRKAIDADPVISEKVLKDQFEKLILQPLSEANQAPLYALELVIVVCARATHHSAVGSPLYSR